MKIYYCFGCSDKAGQKTGHAAGYALLSYALKKEYQIDTLPKIEKGRYGKPFFPAYPQIHFNISHCNGMAACILAEKEVGIDTEKKRQVNFSLIKKALTEQERKTLQNISKEQFEMSFLQYWTLKESFIKAIGRGLSFPLEEIEFYLTKSQTVQTLYPLFKEQAPIFLISTPILSNQSDWQFVQFYLKDDYFLSVCFHKEEPLCQEQNWLQAVQEVLF